ncbi:MAG: hypothetical protein Greene041619_41 [Candidatus Peregrinibacteria bacterium Greene0416_19]|nr:MAG: hypothetical protein Greene041619_41 [Candidatus Peregrinibacteria bacterium Greene0416_19]
MRVNMKSKRAFRPEDFVQRTPEEQRAFEHEIAKSSLEVMRRLQSVGRPFVSSHIAELLKEHPELSGQPDATERFADETNDDVTPDVEVTVDR